MFDRQVKKLASALVMLSALAVVAYLAFFISRDSGIHELQVEAERRLTAFSATLFAPTDKYSYLPELVSNHPIVADALQHKDDARSILRANIFLDQLNSSAGSAVIYILDMNGLVIAASNWRQPQSFVGQDYAFRPYFQDALRNGNGRFYGMGKTSMRPGFYIAHVVRNDAAILGVAAVKVDLSNLDAEWQKHNATDEVVVTDENGVIFLSSRAEWKYHPLHRLAAPAAEQLKRTHQYDDVLQEPLSVRMLANLRPDEQLISILQHAGGDRSEEAHYFRKTATLPGSGWTINVLLSTSNIEARATRVAIISAGVLAFIMLALMYIGQITHRIQEREKSRRELELTHAALQQKLIELQRVSEELRITSITDPLTGAYNRRFFFEAVGKLVSGANRHQFDLAIVTIDVDHFKRINDLYGHPAGDKVLQALTTICKESLRDADVFARFGGEEFILALPSSDASAAYAAAERLRMKVMEQTIDIKDTPLRITISGGISQYRANEANIDDTLKRADEALYVAKNSGRNRMVLR